MTRHSRSLFFSLLLHISLLATVFVSFKSVTGVYNKTEDKKVCVKLQTLSYEKTEIKKLQPPVKVKKQEKILKSKKIKNQKKVQKKIPKKTELKKQIPFKKIQKKVITKNEQTLQKEKSIQKEVAEVPKETQINKNQTHSKEQEDKRHLQEYMDLNLNRIVKLLQENLYYPRSARKRGIVGEVSVSFTLYTDARVGLIKVISSNSDLLSRSAIKTIQNLSGKFPKPQNDLTLSVPIQYSLSN